MSMRTFAIVNTVGQTLATYKRTHARYALQAFMDDQRRYQATFKHTSIVQVNQVKVIEVK
jgi:hypothetical protein